MTIPAIAPTATAIPVNIGCAKIKALIEAARPLKANARPSVATAAVPSETAVALADAASDNCAAAESSAAPSRPCSLSIPLICVSPRVDCAIAALTASVE